MAALAALSLANGLSTPVNITFDVMTREGLITKYADVSSGITAGFPTVELVLRPARGKHSRKVTLNISLPTLKEASTSQSSGFIPAPEVQNYSSFHGAFLIPDTAPAETKADLIAFAIAALQEGQVQDSINLGQNPY